MTRGLVRNNNLSDLTNAEQARINLGLATADYNRIRGLYSSAGVRPWEIQRIAGSAGNYQTQINSINSIINGINPALYALKTGDTLTGTWTNIGRIGAVSIVQSGSTPQSSSDALFDYDYQAGDFELTTSSMIANSGITTEKLVDKGGVVLSSGVTPDRLVPIKINGVQYYAEAG